jgi:Uma2 family endonuclease
MTGCGASGVIVRGALLYDDSDAEQIMGMPAAPTNWTIDMLDALPDDGQRYEIIDGELFVTPSPSGVHQQVVGALYATLRAYLKTDSAARAMISPSDVRRGDRTRNRVQPDVYAVRLRDGAWPDEPYDLRDLLLAVEVSSPTNPLYDYQVKRDLYLRSGVGEYWIVNCEARMVSRWQSLDDPGEEFLHRITWQPGGMSRPLVIDLPAFFEDALT